MTKYRNGYVPDSELVWFDGGTEKFRSTRKVIAAWNALVADVKKTHGVTLVITPGPNAYRDYAQQVAMKTKYTLLGKPNRAAMPGTSSHGGNYKGRDSMAIDVNNWAAIGKTEFFRMARKHGFATDQVIPQETWHIVMYDPFGPVPSTESSSSSSSSSSSKDVKVKEYHYEDATARKSGRTVKPGGSFYLHNKTGLATSKALNVVGGIGPYSITTHVYATGKPGDAIEVVLMWQDTKDSNPKTKNSDHYTERLEFGADGVIKSSTEFKRAVARGYAVYARLEADKGNKGDVKVTVFDTDAYLFLSA